MDENVDIRYLLSDARARIYLLWAALCAIGFGGVHFGSKDIGANSFWLILSIIGLGYMYKVMPLRMKPAKQILYAWLIPIAVATVISFIAFYVGALQWIVPYLAAFWLSVMALSFALNGLADRPSTWYWVAAGLNAAAALAIIASPELQASQWLVAAIVGTWSMLNLWLFRS